MPRSSISMGPSRATRSAADGSGVRSMSLRGRRPGSARRRGPRGGRGAPSRSAAQPRAAAPARTRRAPPAPSLAGDDRAAARRPRHRRDRAAPGRARRGGSARPARRRPARPVARRGSLGPSWSRRWIGSRRPLTSRRRPRWTPRRRRRAARRGHPRARGRGPDRPPGHGPRLVDARRTTVSPPWPSSRARSSPLTPAAFRDATGTSRKYVLAILEDLDRRGILQRTPEGHIPGRGRPALSPSRDGQRSIARRQPPSRHRDRAGRWPRRTIRLRTSSGRRSTAPPCWIERSRRSRRSPTVSCWPDRPIGQVRLDSRGRRDGRTSHARSQGRRRSPAVRRTPRRRSRVRSRRPRPSSPSSSAATCRASCRPCSRRCSTGWPPIQRSMRSSSPHPERRAGRCCRWPFGSDRLPRAARMRLETGDRSLGRIPCRPLDARAG